MRRVGRVLLASWALSSVLLAQGLPPLAQSVDLTIAKTKLKPFSDAQVFLRLDQLITTGFPPTPTAEQIARFGPHAARANYGGSFFVSTGSGCTATVVGPHAIVTAQHCVIGAGGISLGAEDLNAACVLYSYFAQISNAAFEDLALCWVETPISLQQYETINVDPNLVKTGQELLLGGYGLTENPGAVGDVFVVGEATITKAEPDTLTAVGAQAQGGDSGGAAFAVSIDKQHRFVVGITKKHNLVDHKTSYVTPLSSENSRAFVDWWLDQQFQTFGRKIGICGKTTNDASCR